MGAAERLGRVGALSSGPVVLVCLDLRPRSTDRRALLRTRAKIRSVEAYMDGVRADGGVVLHYRPAADSALETLSRLRPLEGETVLTWDQDEDPFDNRAFRMALDGHDPSKVLLLCGVRDGASADFCMRLANIGYDVHWLKVDLTADMDLMNASYAATLTEVSHPRVVHKRLGPANENLGRKRANDA